MVSVGIPNIVENAGATLGQIAKVRSKVVKGRRAPFLDLVNARARYPKRLTENELSDFSWLWHDGCGKTIIEAQNVEQNYSTEV
jgi:hypothetical protein